MGNYVEYYVVHAVGAGPKFGDRSQAWNLKSHNTILGISTLLCFEMYFLGTPILPVVKKNSRNVREMLEIFFSLINRSRSSGEEEHRSDDGDDDGDGVPKIGG